jgi:hypothetical protein
MHRIGLIVDKNHDKITVMTKDGRFITLRTNSNDYMIGETILLPRKSIWGITTTRIIPALAMSLLLVFGSFFGYTKYLEARPLIAYVTLDSIGSVELGINDKSLVKTATAFDAFGSQLLSEIDWYMKPVEQVVKLLVEAQKNDELGPLVAVVSLGEPDEVELLETKVNQEVNNTLNAGAGSDKQSINAIRIDQDTRDAASDLNISAARAFVWAAFHKSSQQYYETPYTLTSPEPGDEPKPGRHQVIEIIKESLPAIAHDQLIAATKSDDPDNGNHFALEWINSILAGHDDDNSENGNKPGFVPPGQTK